MFRKKPAPVRADTANAPPTDDPSAGQDFDDTQLQVQDLAIGEILVRAKKLEAKEVQAVLNHQRKEGVRFGDAAIALGYVRREDVLWALSQQFHYPYIGSVASGEFHEELFMANTPFSDEVEAFRDLRSHLLMSVLGPSEVKHALAIVSADIGDGKTFTAANLAVAFSQLPGRTLIVDCDMRSPRLHEVFGMENTAGLSNILSGRSEPNVIRPVTSLPNLFLLPVGAIPPNPLELLQRNAFALLTTELLSRFDYVLFDTPAAAHGSDVRLIAARAGAALMVSRKNQTHTKAAQRLAAQLTKASVQMAGVVLNSY